MREMALETIREFRMIHPGEAVAVACSGGADSTALLLLLNELSNPLGCVLSVAHLNHCLRGSDSDADEQFVRGLAERLGISFSRSSGLNNPAHCQRQLPFSLYFSWHLISGAANSPGLHFQ